MVDDEVPIFNGRLILSDAKVTDGAFEWRPATMMHKIVSKLDDKQIDSIEM